MGFLLAALAGALDVPLLLVGITTTVWAFRYFTFILPLFRGAASLSWPKTILLWSGLSLWEALPSVTAITLGLLLIRKQAKPVTIFVVVAGIWSGLSIWMLRPYAFEPAAVLFVSLPAMIWAFGSNLAGGMILGWGMLLIRWIKVPVKRSEIIYSIGIAFAVLGGVQLGYQQWLGRCNGMSRKVVEHKVIAIPGGMPPFAANFAGQSNRAIYPMIMLSSTLPDLVMAPENEIQVNSAVDPQNEMSALQRHLTAIGIGVGVPFSQALYGVRDFNTSRIYFTDIVNGKPRVQWKDLEKRVPGIDYQIPYIQKYFPCPGYTPAINKAAVKPLMELWRRTEDANASDGIALEPISKGIITMSGEIRDPKLVLKVRNDPRITAALNPTISGWMGYLESTGASVQAKGRLLELGLIGYRVGQLSGTELVVPWLAGEVPVAISPSKDYLRFGAPLPYSRIETGYTKLGWQFALYIFPIAALVLLLLFVASRSIRMFGGLREAV